MVGATDEFYYGRKIDPISGELFDGSGSIDLTTSSFGATLLNLADIDHEPYLSGVSSIPGVLL